MSREAPVMMATLRVLMSTLTGGELTWRHENHPLGSLSPSRQWKRWPAHWSARDAADAAG